MKDSLRTPASRSRLNSHTQSNGSIPADVSAPTAIGVYIKRSAMSGSQPETTVNSQSEGPSSDKSPLGGSSSGSPGSDNPLLPRTQTPQYQQSLASRGYPHNRQPVRKYHGLSGKTLNFAIGLVAGLDLLYVCSRC